MLKMVAVDALIAQDNVRTQAKSGQQAALVRSIACNGVVVPLLVYPDGEQLVVVDGHCRLAAARRTGLESVPVIVAEHPPSAADCIRMQLIANAHRTDLGPIDRALAYQKLMGEMNWSARELSDELGESSESNISKLLSLLTHPKPVQEAINSGQIAMSSAYMVATVSDPEIRTSLTEQLLAGSLTRTAIARQLKSHKQPRRPARRKRQTKQRVSINLGGGRSVSVSAPVMTAGELASWLTDLAGRVAELDCEGLELSELADALAVAKTEAS